MFGQTWLADLSNAAWFFVILAWLFTVILVSAFAVVRHAESLAVKLGEPLGTLVLTLSVTGIEVMMIAAMMYTGHGNPSLARDAMFAVVMIVLNGMVGLSLLLGGLRYHEQTYNLQGANAYLAVIVPLAVLGLILPNFTVSSPGPTFSPSQAAFLIVMSIGLYGVFLAIQNLRHREYFMSPSSAETTTGHVSTGQHGDMEVRSVAYHTSLLVIYLLPLIILSKQLAIPIDYSIRVLRAPSALGGFIVAVLILAPESLGCGAGGPGEPTAAFRQHLVGIGASDHQPNDPRSTCHRIHQRGDDHPWAQSSGYDPATIDIGIEYPDVRQCQNKRLARHGAFTVVLSVSDAYL